MPPILHWLTNTGMSREVYQFFMTPEIPLPMGVGRQRLVLRSQKRGAVASRGGVRCNTVSGKTGTQFIFPSDGRAQLCMLCPVPVEETCPVPFVQLSPLC